MRDLASIFEGQEKGFIAPDNYGHLGESDPAEMSGVVLAEDAEFSSDEGRAEHEGFGEVYFDPENLQQI
jgi:hypothetical protein